MQNTTLLLNRADSERCLPVIPLPFVKLSGGLASEGSYFTHSLLGLIRLLIIVFQHRTVKKAERRRIDAFELWCWRRLRVPWTARRPNQSILNEINPEYSLEGLMLKLKLLYFGHLMQRTDSLEKTLMLGKTEGRRRRG